MVMPFPNLDPNAESALQTATSTDDIFGVEFLGVMHVGMANCRFLTEP